MIRGLTVSADAVRALASAGSAAAALPALVAGQLSIRKLLLLGAVEEHRTEGADLVRLNTAAALLARADAVPGALDAVLGAPETGLWAARRVRAAAGSAGAEPWPGDPLALVSAIAAAAGIRARLDFELEVPLVDGLLVLPGLGLLPTDWRDTARVTSQGEGRQVGVDGLGGAERGWIRPLEVSLAAPGTARAAGRGWTLRVHSGGRDVRADQVWRLRHGDDVLAPEAAPRPADAERTLAAAWSLLTARHPGFAADLAGCVTDVIPLRRAARNTSASSPSAFGAVWVELGRTPLQVAMSLVHECQHSVLAALHDLLPLHDDDPRRAYSVPWHTEPRTVNALLHGLYAHTAQAEFWHGEARCGTPGAAEHRDRLLGWCRDAAAVARTARGLTTEGGLLVEGSSWRLAALASSAEAGQAARGAGPRVMDAV